MHLTSKLFLIVVTPFLILTTVTAQTSEELSDKIAKAYCDSLTNGIPSEYKIETYVQIESKWDNHFFTIKNQDIIDFLKVNNQLKPKNGAIDDNILFKVAEKAVRGCAFFMAQYGNGAQLKDVKASLIDYDDLMCSCLESKTKEIEPQDLFYEKQQELMGYLQECGAKLTSDLRTKIVEEYNITDVKSTQLFGKTSSGFLFISCPKLISAVAHTKAAKWFNMINYPLTQGFNKAGWQIVNSTKSAVPDSLSNQFIGIDHFNKSLPELKKLVSLNKEFPDSYVFTRFNDDEEINGKIIKKFILAGDEKALGVLRVEYDTDAYSRVQSVKLIPRNKIENLKELDKDIKSSPPPPPPPPPPPKN